MHRTSMGAIVSASAALVATAALVGAGCSTQTATPADAPTASTLEPATISGNAKGAGNPVSAEDVQALWAPVAAAAAEGGYTAWGTVVDAQTGEVLLDAAAATPHTTASTTKTLAKDTAAALAQRGITSVTLNWRGTLFEGASHLSSWDAQEVGSYEGHVGPMAIDAGRTYEGANTFYSDAPGRVAEVFSQALGAEGISATLGEAGDPPAGAGAVAQVSSATMGEQLRWMLAHSDNTLADQYCRFAARAAGAPSTYEGATETVRKTLTEAGVPTEGLTLEDCSGLSSNDKISANTLVGVLKASYEGTGTEANTMRLLPWAGLVGTLSKRMTEEPAVGNVQAKTGALQEVTSLSGSVMTKSGRVLLVSIGHDNVTEGAYATRGHLDAFEEGLAGLD